MVPATAGSGGPAALFERLDIEGRADRAARGGPRSSEADRFASAAQWLLSRRPRNRNECGLIFWESQTTIGQPASFTFSISDGST